MTDRTLAFHPSFCLPQKGVNADTTARLVGPWIKNVLPDSKCTCIQGRRGGGEEGRNFLLPFARMSRDAKRVAFASGDQFLHAMHVRHSLMYEVAVASHRDDDCTHFLFDAVIDYASRLTTSSFSATWQKEGKENEFQLSCRSNCKLEYLVLHPPLGQKAMPHTIPSHDQLHMQVS